MNNENSALIKSSLSWEKITTHYNIKYKEGKNIICPFHKDETPSLSLNEKEPTFHCFGCGEQGDYFNFIALKENINCEQNFSMVLQKAEQIAGTNYLEKKNSLPKSPSSESKFLDPNTIQKNYTQLEDSKQVLDWFKNERGIEPETLKKAHIGYGSHPQVNGKAVIHFPYQNKNGQFIHNRIRELGSGKNIMSEKGAKANIFLAPNLNKIQRVFITEGEIDALTLLQHTEDVVGIPGANGFQEAFIEAFRNVEEVILCGDNDEAGKSFNKKIISLFLQKYPYIQTYYIDWHGKPEKYDINDFYLSLSDKERLRLPYILTTRRIKRTRIEITPPPILLKRFCLYHSLGTKN